MSIKKLLICSASLVMMASLGAGISNVSAKRVHHHSHKTSLVSHKRRMFKSNKAKQRAQYKVITKYLNYVAKYNKSHSKKLNSYKVRHLSRYMNYLTYSQKKTMFKRLNKIQKMNVKGHKSKKYRRANFHHNRKYNLKKRNKKQITKRHTVKRNRKLKKTTKKRTNKRNNHEAKRVTKTNVKKNTNSTNNAPTTSFKNNTSSTQSSQPYDETDGGKYYNWNQLQNVLNRDDVVNGYESDALKQKINDTIMHNLNHYNHKQDSALLSNGGDDELNNISPQLLNDVNNANGFTYGMGKFLS